MKKFDDLPLRESHRTARLKEDFYGDFKLSACEHYNSGYGYAKKVLKKNINLPAKGLVYALRNQTKSKHRSFRMGVEEVIKRDLINNSTWNYVVYVDENGIVRDADDHPAIKPFVPYTPKPDTKATIKFLEVTGGRTDYIMRINGIHYFVTESYFYYSKLQDKRNFYSNSVFLKLVGKFLYYDPIKFQLNTFELAKYNLVNMVE